MADIKRCDICKTPYELYNLDDRSKPNGFKFTNEDTDGHLSYRGLIDCCPQCMSSIQNHIESLRKKEEV